MTSSKKKHQVSGKSTVDNVGNGLDNGRKENGESSRDYCSSLRSDVEPSLYSPSVEKSKSFEVSYRTTLR